MSKTNDVQNILVTTGDQVLLAKDKRVYELLPGQLGVFDASTNMSIDHTSAKPKSFYVAVGLDKDGDAATDDVMRSLGSTKVSTVSNYSYRPHTAARPMKILIKDYTADCEEDYGVSLELRNQKIYRTVGYNQFSKTFVTQMPVCEDGFLGDANILTQQLLIDMNNDTTGFFTAQPVTRDVLTIATHGTAVNYPTPGTVITDADINAIIAWNKTQTNRTTYVYTDIEVTSAAIAPNASAGNIDLKHFSPRDTVIVPSLVEGFTGNAATEVTQEAAYEEGSGYEIHQKEYLAGGYTSNPSPYRTSELNGVERDGFFYNATKSIEYNQTNIVYDLDKPSDTVGYIQDNAVTIAIPAAGTVTELALFAILDPILGAAGAGFDNLADDSAAANVNPAIVEDVTSIDDVALDGLG